MAIEYQRKLRQARTDYVLSLRQAKSDPSAWKDHYYQEHPEATPKDISLALTALLESEIP